MMKASHKLKVCAVAIVSPALLLGVAACGESSDDNGSDVSSATSSEASATASSVDSSAGNAADSPSSLAAPEISVNGDDLDPAAFAPLACVRDEDDGRREIEYKAGDDRSVGKLEVDLALEPLALTSFELKHDGKEYEMDDAEKARAKVTENGDSYTVTGTAHEDDGRETIDVSVTVGCK